MADYTPEHDDHRPWDLRRYSTSSDNSEASSDAYISSHPTQKSECESNGFTESDALEKQASGRLQSRNSRRGSRINRVQTIASRSAHDVTFHHPLSHVKTAPDNLVEFEGPSDPYHPINWPFRKKCVTTGLYGMTTLGSTLASTMYAPEINTISREYGVGKEVAILGVSLTLAGFGLGPLFFGPVSELYGRKPAVLYPYLPGLLFAFACGASKDIQSILITRFFLGIFSSAPIVNTGGVLADLWCPTQRAIAIVFYAGTVVCGPLLGPIIGGALVVTGVDWRWTQFLSGIFMAVIWVLDILILDETYPPVLLVHKARRLRIKTGNWAIHARHEEWDPEPMELVRKFGIRPIKMLMTPICLLVALYASFVYGLVYGSLASFPIIFQDRRGWDPLIGSLPFLALLFGVFLASCINIINQKYYVRAYKAAGNKAVPEARLPPMMIGSIIFSAGCFVLGWTSAPNINATGSIFGAIMLGIGFFTIFQAALNYLVDTFRAYSASAIAANTFLRSIFASAFPLFIGPMYANLGVEWSTSVLGFIAMALIPIPFLFYRYGAELRQRGKYSREMESGS